MRWIAHTAQPAASQFVIEHDEMAGFYVYAYKDGRLIADYLQDTLEIAKRFAFERFNVPHNIWLPVDGPSMWMADHPTEKELRFVIIHDLVMGFELIVSKDGSRINSTTDRRYWNHDLEFIKRLAQEEYGVPLENWHTH
jgi:hypothetical protein